MIFIGRTAVFGGVLTTVVLATGCDQSKPKPVSISPSNRVPANQTMNSTGNGQSSGVNSTPTTTGTGTYDNYANQYLGSAGQQQQNYQQQIAYQQQQQILQQQQQAQKTQMMLGGMRTLMSCFSGNCNAQSLLSGLAPVMMGQMAGTSGLGAGSASIYTQQPYGTAGTTPNGTAVGQPYGAWVTP